MNAADYIKKASEHLQAGEWDNAIMNLKFAEKIEPNNPIMHLFFFNAYGATRNKALAKQHFLSFKTLDPENANKILSGMPDFIREDLGL
jgi:Tfp pilus assembly protein PilF